MPPRLLPRREAIVPDIRKRVDELERAETRQTAHLSRRKVNQSYTQRNSKSILS